MNKRKKILYEIINIAITFVISLVVVGLVTTYVARPIRVSGTSMFPTLHDKDISFSFLWGLDKGSIERFDIVVVYLEDEDKYIVKRVIGLPNETLEFINGDLYIDDKIVDQPFLDNDYANNLENSMIFTADFDEITLEDDEVFLLGDNRPNSKDSRFYGTFTFDDIVSKDIFVIYPLNRVGFK